MFSTQRALFGDLRARVRSEMAAIKTRSVEACRRGSSLRPIMRDQQRLGLQVMETIHKELSPRFKIDETRMAAFISGSYARGTCVNGADFDLNMIYPEALRGQYFPFERAFGRALAYVYDILPDDIHNSVVARAGDRCIKGITLRDFGSRAFFGRYFTRHARPRLAMSFAGLLRSNSPVALYFYQKLATFSMLLAVKYTSREPDITRDFLVRRVTVILEGQKYMDDYFNNRFLFGNKRAFDAMQKDILAEEHRAEARITLERGKDYEADGMIAYAKNVLSDLESGPTDFTKGSFFKKVLKRYGFELIYPLLSFMMRGEALSSRTPDDAIRSERVRSLLGSDADRFFGAMDDLLKIKALIVGSCKRTEEFREIDEKRFEYIASAMGCKSKAELFDMVRVKLRTLLEISINSLEKMRSVQ